MSRLSLLKSKEKELINESVICYSLINQVLLKINSSIKQLEAEQNKSDFRSVYLSTLCLTDQLNEKLVEINLELEDLIVDKQIDTSELDSSQIYLSSKTATPKVLNIDKDCLADDNTISKAAKFNNPHRNENKTLKVNPLKKEKLKFEKNIVLDEPDDDVSICNQPASFVPATQPLTLASLLNQSKSSNIHTKNSPKSSNIPSRVVLGNTDGLSQLNSRQEVNYVENMAYKSGKPTNSGSLHNDVRQRKTTSKTWLNAKGNQTYISESKDDDDYLMTQDTDQTNFISNVCPRNQKSKISSEISTYPTKQHIERELYQIPHHRGTLDSDWENIRHNKYENTGASGVSQDYQTLRENAMNVAYRFSKATRSVYETSVDQKKYQEKIVRESRPSASQCNHEDATAKEISIRKVLEFLTQSNNNRPRRGRARVSEQKRAIDIDPLGFKKSSIGTISTNEAHKSSNIVSTTTTDSYDSYESDRILYESNFDKDLSTEKQNVSSCISERVSPIDSLAESVPVKDCEIEPRNKTDQSVTSCTAEAERYEEALRRIPAEIQVPASDTSLNTKSDEHQNPLDNLDDCKAHLTKAICDHLEGGYQPKDHTRLCRFTQVDGERCFKGDHCHFEHKLPDPDGWTTDRIEAFTITHQIDRPKIGHRLSIMVTFIKSVCRLYAHVKPSKTNRQIYSASKIIYTASQFSRYINKPENINALRKFKILRAEGQLVIATESPSDNKWYRARIISIYSEDEIHMFFIDYGDVCTVSLNQLREIKFEHLGLFGPEQINSSIKQLEPEQNKSDFRSVYLSTLFLTDQLNEKLVEINLELEDLILDKQINTSELENCHAESYQY